MPTPTESIHANPAGPGNPLAELVNITDVAKAIAPFFPCAGVALDGSNAMIVGLYVVTDDGTDHAISNAPLEMMGMALLTGGTGIGSLPELG